MSVENKASIFNRVVFVWPFWEMMRNKNATFLLFLPLLCSCSFIKYNAYSKEGYVEAITDWLRWEYLHHMNDGKKYEGPVTFALSFDSRGVLESCEIEEKDAEAKEYEKELCGALNEVAYVGNAGRKLRAPVTFTPKNKF